MMSHRSIDPSSDAAAWNYRPARHYGYYESAIYQNIFANLHRYPLFFFFFLGDRSLPSLLGKFDRSYVSLLPFPPPVNQLPVKKKERKERKERKIARVHQSGNWEQGGDKILLSRANFWFAIGRGGGIKEYVPYWYGMSNNNVEIKFCVVSDLRQGMSKGLVPCLSILKIENFNRWNFSIEFVNCSIIFKGLRLKGLRLIINGGWDTQ